MKLNQRNTRLAILFVFIAMSAVLIVGLRRSLRLDNDAPGRAALTTTMVPVGVTAATAGATAARRLSNVQAVTTVTTSPLLPMPPRKTPALPLVISSDDEPVATLRDDGTLVWQVPCITSTFRPRRDIRARDLARLLPFIQGACMREVDWKALGRTRRHLQRMDQSFCSLCTTSTLAAPELKP